MKCIAKPTVCPCVDSVGGRVEPSHWAVVLTPHRAVTVHVPTGQPHIIYSRPYADESVDLHRLYQWPIQGVKAALR